MVATVKRPHFEMRGNVPKEILDFAKKHYGAESVVIVEDKADELISIRDSAWAKRREANRNPGRMLKTYRNMRGLTQAALAEQVGGLANHISAMENGKRAISKAMALKLAEFFDVSPDRFI